jgi:hypothetical protein
MAMWPSAPRFSIQNSATASRTKTDHQCQSISQPGNMAVEINQVQLRKAAALPYQIKKWSGGAVLPPKLFPNKK